MTRIQFYKLAFGTHRSKLGLYKIDVGFIGPTLDSIELLLDL